MLMLVAATAVAGAGVTAAIRGQDGVVRDQGTKSALAAAESGVSQAMLRYNRVPTSGANACVRDTGGTVFLSAPAANGWCDAVTGVGGGGAFTYYVKPTSGELEIVSQGTVDGASRRVDVQAVSSGGQKLFTSATVLAQDWLTMYSNASVQTGVATNGDILLSSNAELCGDASTGIGRNFTTHGNAQHTCGVQTQAELTLPPVNIGDSWTNNDNGRLFNTDTYTGSPNNYVWTGPCPPPSAPICQNSASQPRQLTMYSNSSMTLSGSKYSMCRMELSSNTTLYIAANQTTYIYFGTPEQCGLPSGTTQLQLYSNSKITSTGGGAANVVMLFPGSSSRTTNIDLSSNTQVSGACEQNFVIYAPQSDIVLNSNSRYCGALAGKTVRVDSNAEIYTDSGSSDFEMPGTTAHYEVGRFVECGGEFSTTPNDGC